MELICKKFRTKQGYIGVVKHVRQSAVQFLVRQLVGKEEQEPNEPKENSYVGYLVIAQNEQFSSYAIKNAFRKLTFDRKIFYNRELSDFCLDEYQEGRVLGIECSEVADPMIKEENVKYVCDEIERLAQEVENTLGKYRNYKRHWVIAQFKEKIKLYESGQMTKEAVLGYIDKHELTLDVKEQMRAMVL